MPNSATLTATIALARAAGAIARAHFGSVERLTKRGEEAVTVADRAVQRHIVAALRARFPDDGVIGEENDDGSAITHERPRAGNRTWVIDPIDGTNNFVSGFSHFAVCIGLLDGGEPVLGVVYDIVRDQAYAAEQGHGAWRDDVALHAPATPLSERAVLMLTSNLLDADGHLPTWASAFHGQTRLKVRVIGSAALEAVTVAAGIAHGAITIHCKLWDIAAAAAIVLEAGGMVTRPDGSQLFPFDLTNYSGGKTPFLVAGPQAHAELVELMRSRPG